MEKVIKIVNQQVDKEEEEDQTQLREDREKL